MNGNFAILIAVALIAGAMAPTQGAVNHKMAATLESPLLAALFSFIIGTISLLIFVLITGGSLTNLSAARNASPIAWTGGLLGAFFVAASVMLIPKLGVALTFSLIVAGQMLVTLVIDHYGLLDVPVKEINLPRIAGILLITVGVVLIRKF